MTNSSNNLDMIDKSFFNDKISVDTSKMFPVVVMATMSSGKSTLINALLDMDILPNKNEACTAKVYSILDDDSAEKYKLYITDRSGNINVIEDDLHENLEKANNNSDVNDILIVGDIKGVLNTDKSLLVIDTPGPNNSGDKSHAQITANVLEKVNNGLILYVINATQMGINDDKDLLVMLRDFLKKHEGFDVLFVINKVDELDFEKESLAELMRQTKDYIESNGIKADNMIPISALAANLIKKVLSGRNLTRKEMSAFFNCYDLYKTTDMRMTSFAITYDLPNQFNEITLKGETYTIAELKAALDNTGILYLEKQIQKAQILSSSHDLNININNSSTNQDDVSTNQNDLPSFSMEYDSFDQRYQFKKNGKEIMFFKKIRWYLLTQRKRYLDNTQMLYELRLSAKTQNGKGKELLFFWLDLIQALANEFIESSFVLHFDGSLTDFCNLAYCLRKYTGGKDIYVNYNGISHPFKASLTDNILPNYLIEYIPHFCRYEFKKNGIPIESHSRLLQIARDIPLPDKYRSGMLSDTTKYSECKVIFDKWTELLQEITDDISEDVFVLYFKGPSQDFSDLQYCVREYNSSKKILLDLASSAPLSAN